MPHEPLPPTPSLKGTGSLVLARLGEPAAPTVMAGRLASDQETASAALRRSVISIEPGAWVMQNSGRAAAIAA